MDIKRNSSLKISSGIYRLYKTEFGAENYVQMNLTKCIRSSIAKVRWSTLQIRIEAGQFERLEEKIDCVDIRQVTHGKCTTNLKSKLIFRP